MKIAFDVKKLIIFTLLFFSLTACGSPSSTQSQKTPESKGAKRLIGAVMAGSDACYNASTDVLVELAKKEGWETIKLSSDYSKEKELKNVQELIAKKVDAIAIITTDIKIGGECAKIANDAKIPVFFYMTMPDLANGAKATSIVTTDWYMTGYVNGKAISESNKNAKCALIEGGYDQGMTEMMRQGFIDGLNSVAGSKSKVVVNYSGGWMKPNAMAAMEELLKSNIQFDTIFTGNEEMMIGAIEVLKNKNLIGKYKLYAENGREDAGIKFIKEGLLEATAGAPTTADGDVVFQLIKAHFEGKTLPYHVLNPVKLITKNNIQDAVPWSTAEYIRLRSENKIRLDYKELEIVKEERKWSKEGNNYESVSFYK
ncbi:MAG: sugar ABC transporter substrate-binding protein [Bacillota bacterium]|nr:sugar ABC transporter substrate-binding protein [Bacillota bacterium]